MDWLLLSDILFKCAVIFALVALASYSRSAVMRSAEVSPSCDAGRADCRAEGGMMSALHDIETERNRAHAQYGAPTSTHEALGVLIEEMDELRAAIHANKAESIRAEAVQVAAVAYRLVLAIDDRTAAFEKRSGFA